MATRRGRTEATRTAASPANGQPAGQTAYAVQPLNRRRAIRLLGSLAGAAAGAAALSFGRPEQASADGTEGPTAFSGPISATNNTTTAAVSATNSDGGDGVYATSTSAYGVESHAYGTQAAVGGVAHGNGDGIYGSNGGGMAYGVEGFSSSHTAAVYGGNSGPGPGVEGSSDADFGVYGISQSYVGVYGSSYSSVQAGVNGEAFSTGPGVRGFASSASHGGVEGVNIGSGPAVNGSNEGTGPGVQGMTTTPLGGQAAVVGVNSGAGGPGVVGFSPSGTGVGGGSGTGIGFGGVSSSGSGVQGQSAAGPAIVGVVTGASTGTNYSGHFTGGAGVLIEGDFAVMSGHKGAAVRAADGALRLLYCVESPESWFEDFGSAQLSNGSTTVQLEPGFAGVVKTDAYHVFLTAEGETNGLHVTNKTPSSFQVREGHGGTSNASFSYRVVAKRKDIPGERLQRIEEPPRVQLLNLPEPLPMPPTRAAPHSGG
jgi:hypothetical protein